MNRDLGFWNQQGEYIEDIQEVDEKELKPMKYNYEYTENDYKTPPALYQKALNYFNLQVFSLDAACSDKHIPALNYYINGEHDGLTEKWKNNTWCNPPFNECKKWVKKAYEENKQDYINIAMLLPARTETAYFHDYILHNPHCKVEFLRKGYKFLNKDGQEMGVFKNALCLVYFKSSV